MKRILFIVALTITATLLIAMLALWILLSSWVPTRGKALLIQTIEHQLPAALSIEAMRYEPLHGFLLEGVQARDRTSRELWASFPIAHVQIRWFSLMLQGQLAFRAHATLDAPCRTDVSVLGRYHPRTKSLWLDLRTGDIALSTIADPVRRSLPPALTDGVFRPTLHLLAEPSRPLTVSGRVAGTRLAWMTPFVRVSGDMTFNGSATAPRRQGERWGIEGVIGVHHTTATGLPTIHTVTDIEGSARLSPNQLDIEALNGTALGSRWNLEGTLAPITHPVLDVLLRTRLDTTQLPMLLGSSGSPWQLSGATEMHAACHGPTQPAVFLDCRVRAEPRDVTLMGAKLLHPITHLGGRVEYDVLARQLAITQLSGRILEETLTVNGEIAIAPRSAVSLDINGTVPLDALVTWLPPHHPISQLSGRATLALRLDGPLTNLRPSGRVELRDAAARFRSSPHAIEGLTGPVVLRREDMELGPCALQLAGEPLTLTAHARLDAIPVVSATARFPHGELSLAVRIAPQDLLLDHAQLALPHSLVQLSGTLGRDAQRPSALSLTGSVSLDEWSQVPWLRWPALEPWQLRGLANIELQFLGALSSWPDADLRGRVRADHVSVRQVPIDALLCDVTQDNRVLHVRVPMALVADGKLLAEATVEHQATTHEYLFQADLVGLQLARLTEVIPAWRNRSVEGTASAHALLSGTWEERPGWRGEGWVNASGQGLGNLPLLDKVFHGLFGVLGDRMGLETLRRAEITQASVRWRLSQERFSTEQLRLGGLAGTEPVAVYARGSVGFDQTLDFVIEPELSEGVLLEAPTTSTLAKTILKAAGQVERLRRLIGRHRLTGTLKQPVYRFELSSQDVLKQLAPAPVDLLQNLLDAVR